MQRNVLISDDGTPVLADFGNSIMVESSLELTRSSRSAFSRRWAVSKYVEYDRLPKHIRAPCRPPRFLRSHSRKVNQLTYMHSVW